MTYRHKELFKLPNNIFNAKLSATELTVLAAVYSLRGCVRRGRKYVKINQKSLASICGFSCTATISKAMNKLCRLGYVLRVDRYYDDYNKLGAYVYTIPVIRDKGYFFVNRRVFKCNLTTAQMRMYLYFCKCSDSHSKRFWNSYNDICFQLNLQRSAVIKCISELVSMGLIKKYKVKKKDGSFCDNHYKIVSFKAPKFFGYKKRRCCFSTHSIFRNRKRLGQPPLLRKPISVHIIQDKSVVVNAFQKYFFNRGSPKISRTLYSTHFYTIRIKKKIKLYLKYRCNLKLYIT